jgi:hypothetical protein
MISYYVQLKLVASRRSIALLSIKSQTTTRAWPSLRRKPYHHQTAFSLLPDYKVPVANEPALVQFMVAISRGRIEYQYPCEFRNDPELGSQPPHLIRDKLS